MNEEKIIEKFVNSKDFFVIENYISKPYEETIEELEHNWNELKKYIGSEWYCFDNESVEYDVAKDILNKMQELEEGGNNDC